MKRALPHPVRSSAVESLERRMLLSGNVLATLVNGTLNIAGDDAANVIVVTQAGTKQHQLRISGANGTSINNQSGSVILNGITRGVIIRMAGGADNLTLRSLSLPGNVAIAQGGADTLTIDNTDVEKSLMIRNTSSLLTSVTTTTIADTVIGKNLLIAAGPGGEDITLASAIVHRETDIVTGKRSATVTIDDSIFVHDVRVLTGRNADAVLIETEVDPTHSRTRFGGPTSITLGAGDDLLQLGVANQIGSRASFADTVNLDGGAGNDSLRTFNAIYAKPPQIDSLEVRTTVPNPASPTMTGTNPANNSTAVAVNRMITATFSEAMNPLTINTASVTLTAPGAVAVPGTVEYAGTTMSFTPTDPLAPNTLFTATITTAAEDLAGNALANDFVWSFTTGAAPDTTAPTVTTTEPADNATNVALNQKIAATFSEAMDVLTITTANVTVTAPNAFVVPGTVDYVGTTMTFTPTNDLAPTTLFTVTISADAKDLAGNSLASDKVWTFTTGATPDATAPTVSSTTPANNATGVALNRDIVAIFSEAMDPLTITTTHFTLTGPGSTNVTGTVSYVGTTATFTPTNTLSPNTTFTATVTTAAKDLAGNALASDFAWSFTTGATPDTTAPTVSSTDPADGATGVALNKKIAATFSEAMDPLTITNVNVTVTAPNSVAVPGTVDYVGTTMTFTPTDPLAPTTLFTVTISTDAKDLAGNPLASAKIWTFTTGATPDTTAPTVISTNPTDGQTNVPLNKTFAATFSESMDPLTITTANFAVTGAGGAPVAGTVNYDAPNKIVSFTPAANLAVSTVFTATVAAGVSGVKDLAGNPLANDKVWTFTTGTQIAQAFIDLGAATSFAVMATASITSTGATEVNGDVGLRPGTAQGVPPGQVNGAIHVNDQAIADAQADLLAAYNDAVSRTVTSLALAGNIGGLTFFPGLYTNSTSVLISGSGPGNNVTLDAQGDPNAIFIFKMGSTLTTGPGAHVVLAGGAKASNIFWQAGSSATLDTTTIFKGNILASVTITVNTGSLIDGRLLGGSSTGGSVTINASTVTVPAA